MQWLKSNYKKILLWVLLLAIAPLFIELIFIANIVGVEVALTFFVLVVKDIYDQWHYRSLEAKLFVKSAFGILRNHPMFSAPIFSLHATASALAFLVFGSLMYSAMVWYPLVVGGKLIS